MRSPRIILLPRIFDTNIEPTELDMINKHLKFGHVGRVKAALGKEDFKKIEDSFLGPIVKLAEMEEDIKFSRALIHHLLVTVISIIGDPNLHKNLVDEPIDMEFEKVIQLVKQGFKFLKQD
ncbi:unnamed protein product [Cochlearia groenlandica]